MVCQDGIVRFLRYDTCRLLFELGSSNGKARPVSLCRPEAEPITYAAPSSDGHYVATIVDSGAVQLFSIETVCPQLSQPPAPLVQTVRAERKYICEFFHNELWLTQLLHCHSGFTNFLTNALQEPF